MPLSDHYQLTGSGSPIVFVHGSYATTSTWKKMIEQLSARHTCIAIKLPGHCGTPDPQDFEAPTIETELSLIEDVVRSLTDEPIHLVGHSYGGGGGPCPGPQRPPAPPRGSPFPTGPPPGS